MISGLFFTVNKGHSIELTNDGMLCCMSVLAAFVAAFAIAAIRNK